MARLELIRLPQSVNATVRVLSSLRGQDATSIRQKRKEKGRKNGEAKPKPFLSDSGLDSGQLLEVGTPAEVALNNHL